MVSLLRKEQANELFAILRMRCENNMIRHPAISWAVVERRLSEYPEKLKSLWQMEQTGGEPDVVAVDSYADQIVFVDGAEQSPKACSSLCYDAKAWAARKNKKLSGDAQVWLRRWRLNC